MDKNVRCGGCGCEYFLLPSHCQAGELYRCQQCGILTQFTVAKIDAVPCNDPYAEYSVTFNGEKCRIKGSPVTYERLVEMACGKSDRILSVTYSDGPLVNREGLLLRGQSIFLTDGMTIVACDTSRA